MFPECSHSWLLAPLYALGTEVAALLRSRFRTQLVTEGAAVFRSAKQADSLLLVVSGEQFTPRLGHNSHLMGHNSHLVGHNSHLIGHNSHLMGHNSHLMGHNSHLMGHNSHLMDHNSHCLLVVSGSVLETVERKEGETWLLETNAGGVAGG
jgi:hypothetical protein